MSWDQAIVTINRPDPIEEAVWSPCSRLIAIGCHQSTTIEILDAATLKQLYVFELWEDNSTYLLTFSPDGRWLTWVGQERPEIPTQTWDLQTGIQASDIPLVQEDALAGCVTLVQTCVPDCVLLGRRSLAPSITYSGCGRSEERV